MWRRVTVGVLVVACSNRGSSPTVRYALDPEGPTRCPAKAELEARLRALWSVPAGQELGASCTSGRFPASGWAISAAVDVSQDEAWERSVVLAAADGAVLAQREAEPIAPWYRAEGGGLVDYQTYDFDGDGVDELESRGSTSHGGSSDDWLAVERMAGGALDRALLLTTHYDNGAAVEDEADAVDCTVEIAHVPDGKTTTLAVMGVVHTARAGPLPEDCFAGPRIYRLVGGTFTYDK